MRPSTLAGCLVALLLPIAPVSAQSVVLDEGVFAVSIRGRAAGTEEFWIRRSGSGPDGTVLANARASLELPEGMRTVQVVLAAEPGRGTAQRYQLEMTGARSVDLRLHLVGPRYVSVMRTPEGQEEREFPAREGTRILEAGIAHHYYFLRDVREGASVSVIEPRTRSRLELRAVSDTEEQVRLGRFSVEARKVVFEADGERRTVWFDRQGRVVRVEVPAIGYVAERTDLVG